MYSLKLLARLYRLDTHFNNNLKTVLEISGCCADVLIATQPFCSDSFGLVCPSESRFGTVIDLPHLGHDPFWPAKSSIASNPVWQFGHLN
jgi:hypothetical protein